MQTDFFFFFNDTATTEIYTLSLHDALPIWGRALRVRRRQGFVRFGDDQYGQHGGAADRHGPGRARRSEPLRRRSEEHTSELQSRQYLVCRLLLEKKKKTLLHASRPKLNLEQ